MPVERSIVMSDQDGEIKIVTCVGSGLISIHVQAGALLSVKVNVVEAEAQQLASILADSAAAIAKFNKSFEGTGVG